MRWSHRPLRVKTGKAHYEHMFSALPPESGHPALARLPIGRIMRANGSSASSACFRLPCVPGRALMLV